MRPDLYPVNMKATSGAAGYLWHSLRTALLKWNSIKGITQINWTKGKYKVSQPVCCFLLWAHLDLRAPWARSKVVSTAHHDSLSSGNGLAEDKIASHSARKHQNVHNHLHSQSPLSPPPPFPSHCSCSSLFSKEHCQHILLYLFPSCHHCNDNPDLSMSSNGMSGSPWGTGVSGDKTWRNNITCFINTHMHTFVTA